MAGSSGMHFGRAAYRTGMVSRSLLIRWGVEHIRFRLRGSTDERTEQLLRDVKVLLEGVPERDVNRLAPDLLAGLLPRMYPQMIDEVRAHQDAGRPAFIVSAASDPLVKLIAQVLDMDGGVGTRYEVASDGTLTGNVDGPFTYGKGKVIAMEGVAAEHDLDLATSWAYSDSASDLPMLRAVGNPVVVNPDPELAEVAKRQGWRVMRFEKLGRRLAIGAGAVAAGAIGGSGTWLAVRRRPRKRRPILRRG